MKNKTLIKTEYLYEGCWYEQSEILELFPTLVELSKQLDSKAVPTKQALLCAEALSDSLVKLPVRFTYR